MKCGALCIKLNEKCLAKLYLLGSYCDIAWNDASSMDWYEVGYGSYGFKPNCKKQPAIIVTRGVDDENVIRLIETEKYILKIENDSDENVKLPTFQNENNRFLKIDRDKESVTFQFVNYLGRSKITFPEFDKTISFEVVPDKMDYEDDYIRLTEALAEECAELLLDYAGPTSNPHRQSEMENHSVLAQFIFLRKFCYGDNLRSLFGMIKRNPDHILNQDIELKPVGQGKPSPKFYNSPFMCSRGFTKIMNPYLDSNVYIPQMIAVTHKYDQLDTPANRFIKFALYKFYSVCSALIDKLENDSDSQVAQFECLKEAKTIQQNLDDIFCDNFFEDVGELDIMPQNNQVLQKRQGYSQIFLAYSMLDLALQLDWRGKDDIYEGESKDVALLYEYWLFFELFEILKSIDGCSVVKANDEPFIFSDDYLTILLKKGIKSCQSYTISKAGIKINLYYNRTFSHRKFQDSSGGDSYSRPFRPDYTIAIFPSFYKRGRYNGEEEAMSNGGVSYIHFDAKYRITDLTGLIGNIEQEDEDVLLEEDVVNSVINTYKTGDLLKMHTYNDAIRRTVGSYILYPGSFDNNSGNKDKKTFELYDEILPGVGAFSIKPSTKEQGEKVLKEFIETVIKDEEKRNSRLNRLKYYTEIVLKEPPMESKKERDKTKGEAVEPNSLCVLGYLRDEYFNFLKEKKLLDKGGEFVFYFYAIKGEYVYSHHKDVFNAKYFRFYKNEIEVSSSYKLESVLCKINSNELISRTQLVSKLKALGYDTEDKNHHADFYYVLNLKVEDNDISCVELKISDVNNQNGNDTFSPHSPKVISLD